MDVDFSDFRKPLVVLGLVVSFILGGAVVYNTVVHQIPALEQREDKQDKTLDEKFSALGGSMDKQFAAMNTSVSDKLTSLGLTVHGLQTNMIRLCGQKRLIATNCDVKALVAEVQSTSQIQAEYLAKAYMKLEVGSKQPLVTDARVKDQLPAFSIQVGPAHASENAMASAEKAQLANAILWSSAADSARWRQDGNTVVVDFKNGTAHFDLSRPTTKEHMVELLRSLNTTTEALKGAGNVTANN